MQDGERPDTTFDMPISDSRSTVRYYEEVGRTDVVSSAEEESSLILLWRNKADRKARDRLIGGHLRYVVKIARQYSKDPDRLPDLIAAGNMGLLAALDRYDLARLPTKAHVFMPGQPRKQTRFIVYATWWIREYIRQEDYGQLMAHVPVHRQKAFRRKMRDALQNGTPMPEPDAISVSLSSVSSQGASKSNSYTSDGGKAPGTRTLDETVLQFGGTSAHVLYTDDTPDEQAEGSDIRQLVQRSINKLTPREQTVLNCYYGFRDEPRTLPQIASLLGLSDERVRQIKIQAMERIKSFLTPEEVGFSIG